jgi:hypothetical protein
MKKLLIITIILIANFTQIIADNEIKLCGIYQGENLYVMNPFSPTGVGFCITEVLVNGKETTDEINSSAFEIDLSVYGFKLGDKVEIIIKHRDGCNPKILNPEVIKPKSTFNIESIKINKNGTLTWITSGEVGSLPFYVEQFKWNKWVREATVQGVGTPAIHSYSAKVHFITGENRFRVKQIDYSKHPRFSPEVKYINFAPEVTFKPGNGRKTSKYIKFSAPTEYEIFNYYGQLVKRGYAKTVDISALKSGTYFLNYDNKTETFDKR